MGRCFVGGCGERVGACGERVGGEFGGYGFGRVGSTGSRSGGWSWLM